jgi:DNA-binding transcriptional ArsR family regulator
MDYEDQARIFRLLGNPTRIQILVMLAHGPFCVSDFINCTKQRQAYVSQQLMVLRLNGLVGSTKEGWRVCYALRDTPETGWLKRVLLDIGSERGTRQILECISKNVEGGTRGTRNHHSAGQKLPP